jgi:molybdate transport system regulatory protein
VTVSQPAPAAELRPDGAGVHLDALAVSCLRPLMRQRLAKRRLAIDPATMKAGNKQVGARLRIVLEPDIAIGPGKADLLEGIKQTGSIAAAGRRMGMSYKRAWLLVETMNRCFRTPLVETSRGGRTRGGALLTPTGKRVLDGYRRMEAETQRAVAKELRALHRLLRDAPKDPNG